MRNSINGAWILMIVITFMMILIAYIAISINYSNAYRLKTSLLTKIEQYEGLNQKSIKEMTSLIKANGYKQLGYCHSDNGKDFFGILNGHVSKNPTTKQNVCIYRDVIGATSNSDAKYFYEVVVFFGFNLPVLGELYTFRVSGETGEMHYVYDQYFN